MTVIVDRREPDFFKERGDNREEVTLQYGDFLIEVGEAQVFLERKTYGDCWNSLRGGRLDRQLFDLSKIDGSYGLILEQSYVPPHARSSLHAVMCKVNKMAWAFPIIHTLNQSHTFSELRAIEERLQKGTFRTITRPIERVDDSNPRIRILAGIPGIGTGKAKLLLEHYGSVGLALASIDEWENAKIRGFGPRQIQKAREVLEE